MRFDELERELKDADRNVQAATAALGAGNFEEARKLFQRAKDSLEENYGEMHPHAAVCLKGLADASYALGDFGGASRSYLSLLTALEREAGNDTAEVVSTLFKLGRSLERQSKLAEAEKRYRQALHLARETLPASSPLTLSIVEAFASMLKRTGRGGAEAEELKAWARQIRKGPVDSSGLTQDRLRSLETIGFATLRSDKFEEPPEEQLPPQSVERDRGLRSSFSGAESRIYAFKTLGTTGRLVLVAVLLCIAGTWAIFMSSSLTRSLHNATLSQTAHLGKVDGAQSLVLSQMESMLQDAQWRMKVTGSYPMSLVAKDRYKNPVTGVSQLPGFLAIAVKDERERDAIEDSLTRGLPVKGVGAQTPGRIEEYVLFPAEGSSLAAQLICIRGCGSDGRYLPSNAPGKVLLLTLRGAMSPAAGISPVMLALVVGLTALCILFYAASSVKREKVFTSGQSSSNPGMNSVLVRMLTWILFIVAMIVIGLVTVHLVN